jgi:hypothetical protein
LLIVTVIVAERAVFGAPRAVLEPQRLVVTAPSYRASFHRWKCELQIELRDGQGRWRPITKRNTRPEFAVVDARGVHSSFEAPARLCHSSVRDTVVVGLRQPAGNNLPGLGMDHEAPFGEEFRAFETRCNGTELAG